MKNFTRLFIILLLFVTSVVAAQETSSWINYNQNYVRVGVTVKGLQKITFSQLNAAGLGVNASNVDKLQLFYRGQEVAIVKIENEDVYFYGVLNDGASDSLLYKPHSARLNPNYSLFSNVGSYFFTIGSSTGKRATTSNETVNTALTPVPWHWETILQQFTNQYSNPVSGSGLPVPRQSYLTNGESFVSLPITSTSGVTYSLSLANRYIADFVSPKLTAMVNLMTTSGTHTINVKVGAARRTAFSFANLNGYKGFVQSFANFNVEDINSNGVLPIQFVGSGAASRFSMAYYRLEYPQQMTMNNQSSKLFTLPSNSDTKSRVTITNTGNDALYVLDLTQPTTIKNISYSSPSEGSIDFMVDRVPNKQLELYISKTINTPTNIRKVNMLNVTPNNYNYLIITSKTLMPASEEYATYRRSTQGGGHHVLVADITDIYDTYNYGEPSPIAIRSFVKHMVSDNNTNKNLLLIGHTSTHPTRINKELVGVHKSASAPVPSPYYDTIEQVPGIGFPGSDILLATDLGPSPNPNVPGISIGRLPATDLYQVYNYLEKVKKYEAPNQDLSWRKRALHVSGGGNQSEMNMLRDYLGSLNTHVQNGFNGGIVKSVSKSIAQGNTAYDKIDISSDLNEGVGLVTFYGHGTADVTDYDFGYLSNSQYDFNETNKYPVMYYLGCGISNYYNGRYDPTPGKTFSLTLSADWLFTANKGAIAVIANSYDSYASTGNVYVNALYNQLFNQPTIQNIGSILRQTGLSLNPTPGELYQIANIHQNILLGDPAIKVVRIEKAEFVVDKAKSLFLKSANENELIGQSSNIQLGIAFENKGKYVRNSTINAQLKIIYSDNSHSLHNINIPYIANKDSIAINIPQTTNGRTLSLNDVRRIEFIANNNGGIAEDDYVNNDGYLDINWSKANSLTLYNNDHYALPVTLTHFKANKESNTTLLQWETSEEINSKAFDIERSTDGTSWHKIGTIQATINSNIPKTYSYTDASPISGENLYRLKMIDLDDTYEYSRIESTDFSMLDTKSFIKPNPTAEVFYITNIPDIAKVEVRDQFGVVVKTETNITSSSNGINISHFAPGIYFVSVYNKKNQIVLLKLSKY